jgi:protein-S-isoprenylcysteine O-methyltransferase Ste14
LFPRLQRKDFKQGDLVADTFAYIAKKIRRPHAIRQFVGILFLVVLTLIGKPHHFLPSFSGAILAVIGLGIRFWAGGYVKKDKELATTGPYAFVRNPLYVGNVLLAVGFCLLSGYFIASFAIFLFLYIWLYIPAIRKEEMTLQKLFGDEFLNYKENVRAMWPRLTPYQSGTGEWSGRQWVKNGEHIVNAGLAIALLVLVSRYLH